MSLILQIHILLLFSHENVIVVDLGHLKILSDLQLMNSNLEDATKLELEEKLYDRFNFTLSDFQILMFTNGNNKNTSPTFSFISQILTFHSFSRPRLEKLYKT